MTMRLARLAAFALAVSVAWSSLALESDPLPVPKGSPREHAIGLYNDGVLLMLQKHYAAAQGRRGDAAWERSAIKKSLHEQMDAQSKSRIKRAKEALALAKDLRGGAPPQEGDGQKDN